MSSCRMAVRPGLTRQRCPPRRQPRPRASGRRRSGRAPSPGTPPRGSKPAMPDMDLLLALASHARYHPDRPAIVFGDDRLTYGQLGARVAAVAEALADRPAESRIGVACYAGS